MKYLNKWQLSVILFGVSPLAFFLSRNYSQWSVVSNGISLMAMLLLGITSVLVCEVIIRLMRWSRRSTAKDCFLDFVIIAAGMLAVFPFYALSDWGKSFVGIAAPIALAVLYCIIRSVGFAFLNVFLAAFLVISLSSLIWFELHEHKAAVKSSENIIAPPVAMPRDFQFKHKPNIYLFYLESFHPRNVIKDDYGFDTPELFGRMERDGFVEYPNYYANYLSTLDSALALFSMRHHYYYYSKDMIDALRTTFAILADNNVFAILKNNGYAISILDSDKNNVFRVKSDQIDFKHFAVAGDLLNDARIAIHQINPYLENIWDVIMVLSHEGHRYTNESLDEVFTFLHSDAYYMQDKPTFYYIHMGAKHIEEYEKFYPESATETWDAEYADKYREAANTLIHYLDIIQKRDPDALIIFVGDHGGWRHGRLAGLGDREYWNGKKDINALFRQHGVEPATVATHMVNVLAAIRWPQGITPAAMPDTGLSHVTLFPFVFSMLGGKPYDATAFERNYSTNIFHIDERYMLLALDGTLLKDWKIVALPQDEAILSLENVRK